MAGFAWGNTAVRGPARCLGATLLAALYNITSARNQREGLPAVQTDALGMGYGAAAMLLLAAAGERECAFDPSPAYVASLLYLSLFGPVVAFGCYLTLLGRISAGCAAHVTLVLPVVALGLSTAGPSGPGTPLQPRSW